MLFVATLYSPIFEIYFISHALVWLIKISSVTRNFSDEIAIIQFSETADTSNSVWVNKMRSQAGSDLYSFVSSESIELGRNRRGWFRAFVGHLLTLLPHSLEVLLFRKEFNQTTFRIYPASDQIESNDLYQRQWKLLLPEEKARQLKVSLNISSIARNIRFSNESVRVYLERVHRAILTIIE